MKKTSVILLAVLMMVGMTSCRKKEIKQFLGDYTYKTSGSITVETDTADVNIPLLNSTGQIDIVDTGKKNKVVIIKTSLTGKVETFNATINDDKIVFDTQTSMETFSLGSTTLGGTLITKSAEGKILDDHIIIREKYNGMFALTLLMGNISNSDITTVLERNKK